VAEPAGYAQGRQPVQQSIRPKTSTARPRTAIPAAALVQRQQGQRGNQPLLPAPPLAPPSLPGRVSHTTPPLPRREPEARRQSHATPKCQSLLTARGEASHSHRKPSARPRKAKAAIPRSRTDVCSPLQSGIGAEEGMSWQGSQQEPPAGDLRPNLRPSTAGTGRLPAGSARFQPGPGLAPAPAPAPLRSNRLRPGLPGAGVGPVPGIPRGTQLSPGVHHRGGCGVCHGL